MTRDELVEKMIGESQKVWNGPINADTPKTAMSAVLGVCVEELLPGVTDDTRTEWDECWQEDEHRYAHIQRPNLQDRGYRTMALVEERRRARYSPPKPKTPEERVTIFHAGTGLWEVHKDGIYTQCGFITEENAEIYRLGLIVKLKEQK